VGPVTVTASYRNGQKTASKTVCVRAPIATIEVSPPSKTLFVGNTVHLTATAKNASGSSEFGCDFSPTFTWYSSNLNVATVDQNGNVRGVSRGVANISAVYGSKLGYSQITVFDMTGTWHSQETWEWSGCPAITLEAADWLVSQNGSQLHRISGTFSFSGGITGRQYTYTLDWPAYISEGVLMESVFETGTVSNDGLSYNGTLSWTASYYDENGVKQYCSGTSGVYGVRLSTP
ncbi:MAG: Ig-like domain-containing protein, partial [Desulfobacterales bacterium]|nr:Ig-like domain-containing protein [Desulfobacterales bacterium]